MYRTLRRRFEGVRLLGTIASYSAATETGYIVWDADSIAPEQIRSPLMQRESAATTVLDDSLCSIESSDAARTYRVHFRFPASVIVTDGPSRMALQLPPALGRKVCACVGDELKRLLAERERSSNETLSCSETSAMSLTRNPKTKWTSPFALTREHIISEFATWPLGDSDPCIFYPISIPLDVPVEFHFAPETTAAMGLTKVDGSPLDVSPISFPDEETLTAYYIRAARWRLMHRRQVERLAAMRGGATDSRPPSASLDLLEM